MLLTSRKDETQYGTNRLLQLLKLVKETRMQPPKLNEPTALAEIINELEDNIIEMCIENLDFQSKATQALSVVLALSENLRIEKQNGAALERIVKELVKLGEEPPSKPLLERAAREFISMSGAHIIENPAGAGEAVVLDEDVLRSTLSAVILDYNLSAIKASF